MKSFRMILNVIPNISTDVYVILILLSIRKLIEYIKKDLN